MLQLVLFNVTNGLIVGAFYVLMALGLSLIINLSNVVNFAHGNFLALGRYLWGPSPLPLTIPDAMSQPITPDLFFVTWYRVFMVAIVAVAVIGLFAFLRFTRVGMRIRAGTLDLDTVSALGVNVAMLRSYNFAVGSFLAGLAGVLAAGQIGLNPNMGDDLIMHSFIAIIVGGVGSLTGTLLGGLLIGVAAALTA